VEELVIVIGSAQFSYTVDNPFTAGERVEMLKLAAFEEGISWDRLFVIPVNDVQSHSVWVSHVKARSPSFEVVFTGNSFVKLLFEDEGFEVRDIPLLERDKFNATEIRKKMIGGGNWEGLVPKSVADFIKKIDGIRRIKIWGSNQ
ncbi:MAG: nicotinamide-nucleotide adenylyltransferase, partial [Asgard group archaeon]